VKDAFTGYAAPTGMEVKWAGERRDGQGRASAKLVVDKLGATEGEGGLIEKVDVLAEIPYVIKKALSAVTGTKPYIYQVGCQGVHQLDADNSTSTRRRSKSRSMGRPSLSRGTCSTKPPLFPPRSAVLECFHDHLLILLLLRMHNVYYCDTVSACSSVHPTPSMHALLSSH